MGYEVTLDVQFSRPNDVGVRQAVGKAKKPQDDAATRDSLPGVSSDDGARDTPGSEFPDLGERSVILVYRFSVNVTAGC